VNDSSATNDHLPDIMTLDQVASYLQVPRNTIYHWRKAGGGPVGRQLGKHIRFRRTDVDTWLDAQATTGGGAA